MYPQPCIAARGSSAVLQQRIATTTTTARCNGTAGWHKYITDAMLCAVYKHGKGGMCNVRAHALHTYLGIQYLA